MRFLVLLVLAGCSDALLYVEPSSAEGIRSEILAVHDTFGGVRLHAISREEPFAVRPVIAITEFLESLLYSESLAELQLTAGELELELGRSRGLPEPSRIFQRTLNGAWEPREQVTDLVAAFRIGGSCALLQPSLEPFGVVREEGEARIRKLELIDEDTIFAQTAEAVYLLRRGENEPSAIFRPGYELRSFDFDPPNRRVWVVGETTMTELAFDGTTLVRTSTASGCFPPYLFEEVVTDELGRPIVATHRGGVCRFDLEQRRFMDLAVMQLLFGGAANVLSMVRTPDPAHPLLGSSTGRLYLYDPVLNTWELGGGIANLEPPFLPYALAAHAPGGRFVNWAGGSGGRIFKQIDARDWTPWPIQFPPDYRPCATGEYPRLADTDAIRAILPLEDRLLVTIEFCGAIVELDPSGRCSMLSTIGGNDAEQAVTFDAIDALGSTIVTGGIGGLIYSTRRR